MPHLVDSIVATAGRPLPVPVVLTKIRQAHDYLARHGAEALRLASAIPDSGHWGSDVKRLRARFPAAGRPALISANIEDHNLTEIYNQCATMERLLDALVWVHDTLPDYGVMRCHPTTGSDKTAVNGAFHDNDLVLVNPHGELARFEVSDIVSSYRDANQKLPKELKSLGIGSSEIDAWPHGRMFLVVSAEFSAILRRQITSLYTVKRQHRFELRFDGEQTAIFEVLPRF